MKIINLDKNNIISIGENYDVTFRIFKKNLVLINDSLPKSYFILENMILNVRDNKYFCEKAIIDFMSNKKIIYLHGVQDLSKISNLSEYLNNAKDLKKILKRIKKLKIKISKRKNELEEIWEFNNLIKIFSNI